ncbi:hypothetical protein [Rickettsiales endosymbiont of Trichoplax sp. H2]|uniref:hypothetical protein n=1 Tax=Rickettsiales endosymbiont of Trichoplax sp. H2 TaxID=2021221 RepID=UPI0012B3302A|nr:hypothetical protein [Rickettsiales endosymbiont of Trichoplax sp. H2]MSO14378.1 hypothetical protein [Rickettsiales endosymbiont of Trichoplax sp. H2]
MLNDANNQLLEIKQQIKVVSKTDRVSKQIVRNMRSIEKYKNKILKYKFVRIILGAFYN